MAEGVRSRLIQGPTHCRFKPGPHPEQTRQIALFRPCLGPVWALYGPCLNWRCLLPNKKPSAGLFRTISGHLQMALISLNIACLDDAFF
jgi:hypothetical protein